jgi:cytochrome c biogenesis protein CcdA
VSPGTELLLPLLVLALVDSTSFGTLLIPVWLLLTPGRVRADRVLLFLGTVAAFYLALGIALVAGATTFLDRFGEVLSSTPALLVQLSVGVVLLVLGLTVEPLTKAGKARRAAKRAARAAERGPGRVQRWRDRATSGEGGAGSLVALALTATTIEAASMLPYLAAIGLLTASSLTLAQSSLVLVGYCLVMVLPALLLLVARVALHERLTPLLSRVEAWLSRNSREAIAWVLFILGLYLTANALTDLGWLG